MESAYEPDMEVTKGGGAGPIQTSEERMSDNSNHMRTHVSRESTKKIVSLTKR